MSGGCSNRKTDLSGMISSMETVLLKCKCQGIATHANEHDGLPKNHPSRITDECCEVVETPNLDGRLARCDYFGKPVKHGWYNSNCRDKCAKSPDDLCHCEKSSSLGLWFFEYHPDKEYDTFYCACHGAD